MSAYVSVKVSKTTKGTQKTEWSGTVKPEWVDYHTDKQCCETCSMRDEDGKCALLKMPVPDYAHCEAWEKKAA